MLCDTCRKIKPPHQSQRTIDLWKTRQHSCLYRHHSSFDNLVQSARQGCELCNVFRPFVEHAQLKKKTLIERVDRDDGESTSSGYSHEDPFEDFDTKEVTIRLTKDIIYEDEGDHYLWLDERLDEKNDAHRKAMEDTLEREEMEDKSAGLMPKRKRRDNYEIMQWLFQQKSKFTGPEQLWIRGWTYYGDDYNRAGHIEASTVLTLSAGSVDSNVFDSESEYCLDGHIYLSRKTDLAMQLPGLWMNRHNALDIHREKPLQDLRPSFEFFQLRGMASSFVCLP